MSTPEAMEMDGMGEALKKAGARLGDLSPTGVIIVGGLACLAFATYMTVGYATRQFAMPADDAMPIVLSLSMSIAYCSGLFAGMAREKTRIGGLFSILFAGFIAINLLVLPFAMAVAASSWIVLSLGFP
jgi:hypothetical protein